MFDLNAIEEAPQSLWRRREAKREQALESAGLCSGLFDCDCACAAAPDYTPVANASKEAAEVMAQLGREQIDEAKRQYDTNLQVSKPVVDAQLALMQQGIQQGTDYYEYGKTFRPLEQQMLNEVSHGTEGVNAAERDALTSQATTNADELRQRTQAYEQQAASDIALATGGNQAIANKYAADINADVGTAVADARMGQTQALNTAARQAARYGMVVPSNVQALTNQNAAQLASAANTTRNGSIDKYRGLVRDGIGLKQSTFLTSQGATADAMAKGESAATANRNMRIQDQSLDFARKLDVTGMARGMPGASQGAYSVANQSGNNAVQNQMAPGNAYLGAMQGGIGAIGQGKQIQVGGLSNVLSSQTSYANATNQAMNSGDSGLGGLGSVIGGVASLYSSGIFSDPRLKTDVVLVGRDDGTGLNLYEFSYRDDPDMRRYIGVMANEVQARFPDAVSSTSDGYLMVDYAQLGVEFKEVA